MTRQLTPREQEIIPLVGQGLKNREIGESLGIATGTVKIHLMHIFEKTGVRDRRELAIAYRQNGEEGIEDLLGRNFSLAADPEQTKALIRNIPESPIREGLLTALILQGNVFDLLTDEQKKEIFLGSSDTEYYQQTIHYLKTLLGTQTDHELTAAANAAYRMHDYLSTKIVAEAFKYFQQPVQKVAPANTEALEARQT